MGINRPRFKGDGSLAEGVQVIRVIRAISSSISRIFAVEGLLSPERLLDGRLSWRGGTGILSARISLMFNAGMAAPEGY